MFFLWNCLWSKKEKAKRPEDFSTHHKRKVRTSR
jgi:hypothetical protein